MARNIQVNRKVVQSQGAQNPTAMLINARGDYLLNLPAIRALSWIFDGQLTFVCRPGARKCFFPYLPLTDVIEPQLDYTNVYAQFNPVTVAAEVGPCDLFLSLNPWHNQFLDHLLELLSPKVSIGYYGEYSIHLPLDFQKHNADLAFDLPKALDPTLKVDDFAQPPQLLRESVDFSKELRSIVPTDCRVLIVHADTKQNKQWPLDRFIYLVDWFLEQHPEYFILDIGLRNFGLDTGQHSDRVIPCGQLPLPTAIALIETADLFIGVDSCFLHAADLFRVPGIGLFGPTSSYEFGFRFGPHRHVDGNGTMDNISVNEVIASIESLEEEINITTDPKR